MWQLQRSGPVLCLTRILPQLLLLLLQSGVEEVEEEEAGKTLTCTMLEKEAREGHKCQIMEQTYYKLFGIITMGL